MDRAYDTLTSDQAIDSLRAQRQVERGGLLGGSAQIMKEPELAQAINEVLNLRKVIEETRAALTDFTDRMLVSERVENDATVVGQPVPSFNGGVTGQLRRAINDAETAAREAMMLANKLRQIG